jgi:excisionase family DNA binding protein
MKISSVRATYSSPSLSENSLVWDVEHVARELGCSTRHVRRLVAENSIPYSKVGRLVRFLPAKIREWLAKGGTL